LADRPQQRKLSPGHGANQTFGIENALVLEHEVDGAGELDRQDGVLETLPALLHSMLAKTNKGLNGSITAVQRIGYRRSLTFDTFGDFARSRKS
jgi:hypothetical protein